MSRDLRPFSRFYYDDFLREYPAVYADDAAFATWMRLLVVAEKAWPLSPELPRSARIKSVQKLVAAGLVALGPLHTFSLRGHDAERQRRHGIAVAGANARWSADANASADAMPRRERDETRRDTPPPPVGRRSEGTNQRALGTNPRTLGTSPRQERQAEKRAGMPTSVHDILQRAAKA